MSAVRFKHTKSEEFFQDVIKYAAIYFSLTVREENMQLLGVWY